MRHGVAYESINVLADPAACEDLVRLAGRRVPIARRGNDWVDGQVLADLARIAGISLAPKVELAPPALAQRVDTILAATQRFAAQIPEGVLNRLLPDRPRRYRDLIAHIAQIVEAYLDHVEHGTRVELAVYEQEAPPQYPSGRQLIGYVAAVQVRFDAWWQARGATTDYAKPAEVYYGRQTLHEFFERTAWHAGQHVRQLQLVVEHLGVALDRPLTPADLAGLPLPEHAWDDVLEFRDVADRVTA